MRVVLPAPAGASSTTAECARSASSSSGNAASTGRASFTAADYGLGAGGGVPPDGDDPDRPRYRCEEEGTCDRACGSHWIQLAEQREGRVGRHQRQRQHEGEDDAQHAAEDAARPARHGEYRLEEVEKLVNAHG